MCLSKISEIKIAENDIICYKLVKKVKSLENVYIEGVTKILIAVIINNNIICYNMPDFILEEYNRNKYKKFPSNENRENR